MLGGSRGVSLGAAAVTTIAMAVAIGVRLHNLADVGEPLSSGPSMRSVVSMNEIASIECPIEDVLSAHCSIL